MTPQQKLEVRIAMLKASRYTIDPLSVESWTTEGEAKLEINRKIYERLSEAEYLMEYLFGEEK